MRLATGNSSSTPRNTTTSAPTVGPKRPRTATETQTKTSTKTTSNIAIKDLALENNTLQIRSQHLQALLRDAQVTIDNQHSLLQTQTQSETQSHTPLKGSESRSSTPEHLTGLLAQKEETILTLQKTINDLRGELKGNREICQKLTNDNQRLRESSARHSQSENLVRNIQSTTTGKERPLDVLESGNRKCHCEITENLGNSAPVMPRNAQSQKARAPSAASARIGETSIMSFPESILTQEIHHASSLDTSSIFSKSPSISQRSNSECTHHHQHSTLGTTPTRRPPVAVPDIPSPPHFPPTPYLPHLSPDNYSQLFQRSEIYRSSSKSLLVEGADCTRGYEWLEV